MKRSTVLILAALSAVGLVFVPSLIPTGPTSSLDASSLLQSGQLFVAAGVIFLGGLLTSLTPCVYPLIPITVGVFGARQAESKARALILTSSYVIGMGLVFSALGVFAALSGRAFGSVLGNTWVIVGLAVFMAVLASSMFGAFELALPSGLATKLNGVGGGGIIGALLMGSVAGFLAAPCTGPVLTGVLTWVSQTRDPVIGGGLLFIYALGIGVPFFLIGVFTMRLPKSGVWMEWVKSVFGIALLAMAVSYLRDAFPSLRDVVVSLASALGRTGAITIGAAFAFVGVLIGAIHLSFKEGKQWLPKGLGVAAVLVAFLVRMAAPTGTSPAITPELTEVQRAQIELLDRELAQQVAAQELARSRISALEGTTDPVKTIELEQARRDLAQADSFRAIAEKKKRELGFEAKPHGEFTWAMTFKADEAKSATPFDEALAKAKADCKPVMIDFFADWCAACKELDQHTYVAPQVVAEAQRFVNIKVDGTQDHEVLDALYARFGVQGLPTVAFVSPTGDVLTSPRVTGFLPPDKFLPEMQKVALATCSRTP
jgi:thiol:disulfide interchange protein DsbD